MTDTPQTAVQVLNTIKQKLNDVVVEDASNEFIQEIQDLFETLITNTKEEELREEAGERYEIHLKERQKINEATTEEPVPVPVEPVPTPPVDPRTKTIMTSCRNPKGSCGHNIALMNNNPLEGVSYYRCVQCQGSWQVAVGVPMTDLSRFKF